MEPDPRIILQAFGGSTDKVESLYRWAPVYRVGPEGAWVLKRTRKEPTAARAIAEWTRALAQAGVDTVTPIPEFPENPVSIGDECWILYPFIEGRDYDGRLQQLEAAGGLLGQIHSLALPSMSSWVVEALRHHPSVPLLDASDLASGFEKAIEAIDIHASDLADEIRSVAESSRQRYHERTARALGDRPLPTAICTWDYKASNLVFSEADPGKPTLIDPDNASSIPRLYDLAISLVLFHNFESTTAPRRVFLKEEWAAYRDAYCRVVSIGELELDLWEDVLHAAWVDEGLYVLYADPEEWANPDVRPFFESLLRFDPAEFPLR